MAPTSSHKTCYLASILLSSSCYEGELNEQFFGALRSSPSASNIATPRVLPGPPNRGYFIQSFIGKLLKIPYGVEIVASQQEFDQQIEGYEDGIPDPVNPAWSLSAMELDIRLDLGGKRDAKISLLELSSGELALINFAFDLSTVQGGSGRPDKSLKQESDLPYFRAFLLALTEAYPVLIGTLGLDLDAAIADLSDDGFRLEIPISLNQLAGVIRQAGHSNGYDFAFISPAASGGNKPFVYDCISTPRSARECELIGEYHDPGLVEELCQHAERAEQCYGRMYDSAYPKDDRDDALGHLAKAIRLTGSLGFGKEEARLRERYAQIEAVFNAQVRR